MFPDEPLGMTQRRRCVGRFSVRVDLLATAHLLLTEVRRGQFGETVVIPSAASIGGQTGAQLARHLGVRSLIGTVGRAHRVSGLFGFPRGSS